MFATNYVRLHPMDGQREALDRQWMGSHGRWRGAKRLRHRKSSPAAGLAIRGWES